MKSLKAQLLSALVVMWVGLLLLAAWSAFSARENMMDERKDGLRRVVEAANGVVNSYVADVAAGKISKEEAQKNALERIAAMRYDGDNYLFIFDSRPVVLMLPLACTSPLMVTLPLLSKLLPREMAGTMVVGEQAAVTVMALAPAPVPIRPTDVMRTGLFQSPMTVTA